MATNIIRIEHTKAVDVAQHFRNTLQQLFDNIEATAKLIANNYINSKTIDILDASIAGLLTVAINNNPLTSYMMMESCRHLQFNFQNVFIIRLGMVNVFALEMPTEYYKKLQAFDKSVNPTNYIIGLMKYIKKRYKSFVTVNICSTAEPLVC